MIGIGRTKLDRSSRRQPRSLILAVSVFLVLGLSASAAGPAATITFSLEFPNSDPERYSINVQSDGHARYECSAKISSDSEDREKYQTEFILLRRNPRPDFRACRAS